MVEDYDEQRITIGGREYLVRSESECIRVLDVYGKSERLIYRRGSELRNPDIVVSGPDIQSLVVAALYLARDRIPRKDIKREGSEPE